VTSPAERHDVAILGGGLAGLTLARQLLLDTDKRVVLFDRRQELPAPEQKYGEATVQCSGYYYARVLDLEEHLLRQHYMKYNLRFYWKTPGRRNADFEDYSQSYIKKLSNIATYQLDRNKIEAELVRLNLADPRFTFVRRAKDFDLRIDPEGPHAFSCATPEGRREFAVDWFVDASGRGRWFAKRMGMRRESPIRHGASFMWVDGLVDIERLTGRSRREVRLRRERRQLGHTPAFLATNHFCDEGLWLWVIPLHGRTSIGLVFDHRVVDRHDVQGAEKLTEWICQRFPLFEHDLRQRQVLHWSGILSYAHDCALTIHRDRWALCGEAGRFTDPLYSPGGDLISIYNTVITDAIRSPNRQELEKRTRAYESVMRAVYEAYVPSFAVSYDCLGDQEAYSLKYVWELTVYFAYFVFPFINDLHTNHAVLPTFLAWFGRLGPLNAMLQKLLSDFFQWKKEQPPAAPRDPVFFDFIEVGALSEAEKTFYQVGVTPAEAKEVLAEQLQNLEELARFIVAYVAAAVVGDPALVRNRAFVEAIDLKTARFDPDAFAAWAAGAAGRAETWDWRNCVAAFEKMGAALRAAPANGGTLGVAPAPAAVDADSPAVELPAVDVPAAAAASPR
jgi:2-polyprenyl-6-methoxyphenol hydroxylase-like FAD-dependent oxidoreductase